MIKSNYCTTPESLRQAINAEVNACVVDGETFAVLVEGNSLGEFYINVLNAREITALVADGDSISGMQGYGYRFYNRITDADEIVNEFFSTSKLAI